MPPHKKTSRASARAPKPADRALPRAGQPLDPLAFLRLLWALDHGLRSLSKQMQYRLGITAPQRLVLRLVGRSPQVMPSQLAERLHLDRGTLSGILERLVAQELLVRETHPTDGRSVLLRLSAKGKKFDRDTPGTAEHCVSRALASLPRAKIKAATEVLETVIRAVEASAAGERG